MFALAKLIGRAKEIREFAQQWPRGGPLFSVTPVMRKFLRGIELDCSLWIDGETFEVVSYDPAERPRRLLGGNE